MSIRFPALIPRYDVNDDTPLGHVIVVRDWFSGPLKGCQEFTVENMRSELKIFVWPDRMAFRARVVEGTTD